MRKDQEENQNSPPALFKGEGGRMKNLIGVKRNPFKVLNLKGFLFYLGNSR
jgi:hypothetical protein